MKMINKEELERFDLVELEEIAYPDRLICYIGTRDMEFSKKFYEEKTGIPFESADPEDDPSVGIEVSLEVERQTGDIALFTIAIVTRDEYGSESSVEIRDIPFTEENVIYILEKCGAEADLIKLVADKNGFRHVSR